MNWCKKGERSCEIRYKLAPFTSSSATRNVLISFRVPIFERFVTMLSLPHFLSFSAPPPSDPCQQYSGNNFACLHASNASQSCGFCNWTSSGLGYGGCFSGGPDGVSPSLWPGQCCDAWTFINGSGTNSVIVSVNLALLCLLCLCLHP